MPSLGLGLGLVAVCMGGGLPPLCWALGWEKKELDRCEEDNHTSALCPGVPLDVLSSRWP